MNRQFKILEELLAATVRISEALNNKDIDMVNAMIEKREGLMAAYQEFRDTELSEDMKAMRDRLLEVDQANNEILQVLVDQGRAKIEAAQLQKNIAKKKTKVATKYVTGGYTAGEYSRFNKKT